MDNEKCFKCGESVAQGSGKFVNRIPSCDDIETRTEMGVSFPEGDYICADCDDARLREQGLCVTDEELQEEIRLSKRLESVETLRGIYQDLQDENEKSKNDDGSGQYLADGEWLDQFVEAVGELLKYESRP
ncbi:MAG: hypothetical protein GY774_16655 [Planctomycetes bacterium]|nr:hypothetical protein [Planctomycetota bacterium]